VKATCPVCEEQVTVNDHMTLRRHKGKTEFDLATDGICSGSGNAVPLIATPEEQKDFEENCVWEGDEFFGLWRVK